MGTEQAGGRVEALCSLSMPASSGSILGVAEEALLLAEAADGSKHSHRGELGQTRSEKGLLMFLE